jgi:colanic acid/amylovoran biosynthesis glycosyltransferase
MIQRIAIFSPNQNAYSETFIQAHKNLPFDIKFYYGGKLPSALEGGKGLLNLSMVERFEKKIRRKFSIKEYALYYSLKRERIEVVLAEYGETAVETLNVVKKLGIPLVVHFHGYDASVSEVLSRNVEKYKEVFNYATSVLVVSKKMQNDLFKIGCPLEKIVLNIYGPNSIFFSNIPCYDSQRFVAVGRFVEKKAPYLTILAFAKVKRKYPQAELILVGDGPLMNICQQIVNAMGLSHDVLFKGPLTPGEIISIFQKSVAFVQHSITATNGDSEGTPVAILEAQAAALPVISTFHAGIPDVVIHEETGLLVKEGDIEGMADNMMYLIEKKNLAKKLGQMGRQRVQNHFLMEKHLNILAKELEKAALSKMLPN